MSEPSHDDREEEYLPLPQLPEGGVGGGTGLWANGGVSSGLVMGARPVQAAYPGTNGPIAYDAKGSSGYYQIWVLTDSGTSQLTLEPVW